MTAHQRNIIFTLIHFNEQIEVSTYEGEFRNLMTLIIEKVFVEDFGECKGTGKCGTCLVEVRGLSSHATIMERNEKNTLEKCAIKRINLRLACQIMINNSLHNTIVQIVEEREDLR